MMKEKDSKLKQDKLKILLPSKMQLFAFSLHKANETRYSLFHIYKITKEHCLNLAKEKINKKEGKYIILKLAFEGYPKFEVTIKIK